MSNDTNDSLMAKAAHDRNKEYIAGKEVDVSVTALSRKRNIDLPEDFADTLQSADFYSADKALPPQYPLLLLSNVATVMVMKEISAYLNPETFTENAVNVYVKQRTGGKEVATPVGRANLSLKLLDALNYYLVEYTYYVTKGQKAEIERASLVDYREFNPIIDPGDDVISYADINREPPREKASIGLQTFSEILRDLQEAQEPVDVSQTLNSEGAQPETEAKGQPKADEQSSEVEGAQALTPMSLSEDTVGAAKADDQGGEDGRDGETIGAEDAESNCGVDAISWNE